MEVEWLSALGSRLSALVIVCASTGASQTSVAACTVNDAPTDYWSHTCSNFCVYDGGTETWTCDVADFCSGVPGVAWIAHYEGSSKEYSAWVVCEDVSSTKACCDINETVNDPVNTVVLLGTDYGDTLKFYWDSNSQMEPAFGHDLLSEVRAGSGNDYAEGSEYADADYEEHFYGDGGNDTLTTFAGQDWLLGGDGNDTLFAGDGADRMYGGLGHDDMYGGQGNDVLCDTTGIGPNDCNDGVSDYFDGNDGSDRIWYEVTSTCNASPDTRMDSDSTAGDGGVVDNDICGNDDDWTEDPDADWPDDCETPSNVIPGFCDTVIEHN